MGVRSITHTREEWWFIWSVAGEDLINTIEANVPDIEQSHNYNSDEEFTITLSDEDISEYEDCIELLED